MITVPSLSCSTGDTGDSIVVGVRGTEGYAPSIVIDIVADALSADSSDEEEVVVAEIVEVRGGSDC